MSMSIAAGGLEGTLWPHSASWMRRPQFCEATAMLTVYRGRHGRKHEKTKKWHCPALLLKGALLKDIRVFRFPYHKACLVVQVCDILSWNEVLPCAYEAGPKQNEAKGSASSSLGKPSIHTYIYIYIKIYFFLYI